MLLPLKSRKLQGFTLIELLVALAVLTIFISFIGTYVLTSSKATQTTRHAGTMNRIAPALAETLAAQKITRGKQGFAIVAPDGTWKMDPTTPLEGVRYDYDARLNVLQNGRVYVMVNLGSDRKVFVSASSFYVLPLPTP